jgi:hypothetical protein
MFLFERTGLLRSGFGNGDSFSGSIFFGRLPTNGRKSKDPPLFSFSKPCPCSKYSESGTRLSLPWVSANARKDEKLSQIKNDRLKQTIFRITVSIKKIFI